MHTERTPDDPEVLKEMGYDRRDIDVPAIRKGTLWTVGFSVACFIAAIFFYNFFSVKEGSFGQRTLGTSRPAAQPTRARFDANTPALQDNITTKFDIVKMRREETRLLTTGEVMDSAKGKVRIPIEMAMNKLVEKGVSTNQSVAAQSKGNTITENATGPGSSQPLSN